MNSTKDNILGCLGSMIVGSAIVAGIGLYMERPWQESSVGQYAAPFTLNDLKGQEQSLSEYSGTPVVLNFWATYCAPCVAEMPDLEKTADMYEGTAKFLTINPEAPETIKEFMAKYEYAIPVLTDQDESVNNSYGIEYYPTTIIVDREGKIVYDEDGREDFLSESGEFRRTLDSVIAQR